MVNQRGIVYLIGAGPGDPAYLTVRGQQLLATAEVLVHDALIHPALQQQVPNTCLCLNVGKRGGQPSTPQTEINQILVDHARQGKRVIRLKNGDPFIFGRSTAEIQALKAAQCNFDVVPGVCSALAAPLLAHIPLTDPVLSRSFTVLTAHDLDALNWQAIAQLETLVFLMGGRQLPNIVELLINHGMWAEMPIAIIHWASQPQQQIWTGTLTSIVQITKGVTLSPCVIVIGEVADLRPYLQPQSSNATDSLAPAAPSALSPMPTTTPATTPLQGKTVLITRAVSQATQFRDQLQTQGAKVMEMPALEIGPPTSWAELDEAISQLSTFDWLILTSSNGVDAFFERLSEQGKDGRALAGVKIAVVGKKTAKSLAHRSLKPDFIPPNFVADSLVDHFPESVEQKKILFPRVESGGREVLIQGLRQQGAEVIAVPAYESRCPADIPTEVLTALKEKQVDVITFASSKTVHNFCTLVASALGDDWQQTLTRVCLASIGPQTSKSCEELFDRVDIEAQEYTLDGLTDAIVQWAQQSMDSP